MSFKLKWQLLFGGKNIERLFLDMLLQDSYSTPPDIDRPVNEGSECYEFEIDPLLDRLQGSVRKYTRASVKCALDAILNRGVTVTQASYVYGIKRTSLQHYLKKLNIKIKF